MQRRHFLRSSGGAALALAGLGRHAEALADTRLRVGLIGCGWYGKSALFRLLQVAPAQVVSLCDVDRAMLEKTGQLVAGRQASKATPRLYGDYRRMLAERDLDLAIVSTPDHWHALPMIEAVKSGADVYVEKPISVDVVEGQAMLAAARKNGRVVQVGLQRRSTPHLVEAREEIVKAGKLGRIGQVEIYSYYGTRRGFPKPLPVPATLDWEFWSGPAPLLPYNDAVHPRGWRSFMAYGNGMVGDL
ncbi:MAG: Gfo/Idh/MocA family protein, partial [Vicinamibacteria bacterium]